MVPIRKDGLVADENSVTPELREAMIYADVRTAPIVERGGNPHGLIVCIKVDGLRMKQAGGVETGRLTEHVICEPVGPERISGFRRVQLAERRPDDLTFDLRIHRAMSGDSSAISEILDDIDDRLAGRLASTMAHAVQVLRPHSWQAEFETLRRTQQVQTERMVRALRDADA